VTVDVEYSTLNYKDGLCFLPSGGGLVKSWPHVPGIDFAGTVAESSDDRYSPGDKVILTGWHVGERRWGGYAEKARVHADWLVPLPDGLTTRTAMAVGTAGFTAMLAIMALEDHGLTPEGGEVLVTGAAGGVGSVAVAVLAKLGYQVAAVTGRAETEAYLRDLGASRIVPREEIAEVVKRPLEAETWAGCIDAVGGTGAGFRAGAVPGVFRAKPARPGVLRERRRQLCLPLRDLAAASLLPERKVQPYAPYDASTLGGAEMDEARNRLARCWGWPRTSCSFGPSTSAEHLCAGAGLPAVAEAPARRSSSPTRTTRPTAASGGGWPRGDRDPRMEDRPRHRHARPRDAGGAAGRPGAAGVLPALLERGGRDQPGGRDLRDGAPRGGVGPASTGCPTRRTGCRRRRAGGDIYLFSAYKTYGPHQGIMTIRRDAGRAAAQPGAPFQRRHPDKRFTPAGPDHAQIAACAGMADYVDALYGPSRRGGRDAAGRAAVVHDLMRAARDAASATACSTICRGATTCGCSGRRAEARAPTVAVLATGRAPIWPRIWPRHGIMVRRRRLLRQPRAEAMGVDPDHGVLRLSFVHYTGEDELDRLMRALDRVL
jgi:hypothetical protein